MIEFTNLSKELPYQEFLEHYKKAESLQQNYIEAACISSFAKSSNEVDTRFVNIKSINDESFIFYSNYNSPKALQFLEHKQISAVFFWHKTNTQIRIKASIKKLDSNISDLYFKKRSRKKNALAISSNQSKVVKSYEAVELAYKNALSKENLDNRPEYWGGYAFKPYYFEFWKGHKSRVNKRKVFNLINDEWLFFYLEP